MENVQSKLTMSFAPFIRNKDTVQGTMKNVIIALVPAILGGIYFFGIESLILILTSVASCVFFEHIWCVLAKKPSTVWDLSAVVTGILSALCVPPSLPPYMLVISGAFSIIIVKCCFGGLGQNIVNPALAGRAFMLASWPVELTSYTQPYDFFSLFGADAVSRATPLSYLKGTSDVAYSYTDLFFGFTPGCIGEVSTLLILAGAIYLLAKKVITLTIPLTYIVSLGLFGLVFGGESLFQGDFLRHILSGGAMLAAFFMATDYTTTPVSKKGEAVFGIGAGIITGVIRLFGGYPEGVTYAILIMNVCVPLIDKAFKPRVFGH